MLVVLDELHACGPPSPRKEMPYPHTSYSSPPSQCVARSQSQISESLLNSQGVYIDMPIPSQDHKVHPLATVYWV